MVQNQITVSLCLTIAIQLLVLYIRQSTVRQYGRLS